MRTTLLLTLALLLLPATLAARPADCVEMDADSTCDVNWNGGAGTLQLEDGTNAWNGGPTVTLTYKAPKASTFEQIAASGCTFTAAGVCNFSTGSGILRVAVTGGSGDDLVTARFSLPHQAAIGGGGADPDVATTVSAIWEFDAVTDREWSPLTWDVQIGDGTGEGQIRFGTFVLGVADDTVGGTALDDVAILYNTANSLINVSFVLVDASTDTPRLVLAEEGADLAMHNPRSMKIGPAATWATLEAGTQCSTDFDRIDCDTGGTGADLGLEDDLELGGSIFGSGGDGDGFETELAFTTATADRTFTFGDDGGTVCTDTNGACFGGGRAELYIDEITGGTNDWTASGAGAFEKLAVFSPAGPAGGSAGPESGIASSSVANDEITVSSASLCQAWLGANFSGTGNREIACCLFSGPDSSEVRSRICFIRTLGAGGTVGSASAPAGAIVVAANDRVELHCQTNATPTVVDFWSLSFGVVCGS